MPTVRDQLLARAHDPAPGVLFEDASWSWAEAHREAAVRAAVLDDLLGSAFPRHVGLLLDNGPEFHFLLAAAALAGDVVVGLNTTRRGAALAADVARSDCALVVTAAAYLPLLASLDLGVPVVDVDSPLWTSLLALHTAAPTPTATVSPDDLLMLIFTSGTSGDPKAVRVTHEKVAHPGRFLSERFGLGPGDVVYLSMPMFHSNAVMAGWAPALASGAAMAFARRFSASGFLPDVRRYGATYANYVGKPLTYVLATPALPDDADNPLRLVFGNEANERDIVAFGERFGCQVVDSYSSTENAVVVQRTPDMPPGALGRPAEGVQIWHRDTRTETAVARFDSDGRLVNPEEAVGELVNTTGAGMFAGYYNDPEADAERMEGGVYWSGDLAYRDEAGFFYFAGRTADWLRVDGENLAAAPIERILMRHPGIDEVAVYAVPDETVGDQVMAAVVPRAGAALDAAGFEAFLAAQPDLSPHAWPRYVRITGALPRTATNKILKRTLAAATLTPASPGSPASSATSASSAAPPDTLWARTPRTTTYHPLKPPAAARRPVRNGHP